MGTAMTETSVPAGARQDPVFAISTGRSGSTLVQRLLNCHHDLVMWGEHHGMLNSFGQAYAKIVNPQQRLFPRTPEENRGPRQLLPTLHNPAAPIEWANPGSLVELMQHIRAFMEGYFASGLPATSRWGFKEILYNHLPVLTMLRDLYPQGRFVFIRRGEVEVTRSKVSAFVKEARWAAMSPKERNDIVRKMILDVREHYRVYGVFMERYPEPSIAIDFEDLLENPRVVIAGLLHHLRLDPDRFDWDLADAVLGNIVTPTTRNHDVLSLIMDVVASLPADSRAKA